MSQRRILILTGSLGDGHNKAAQALVEAAGLYYPGVEVKVVDYLEWTHPYLHGVGQFCYMQWVKSLPSVYGFLYRSTRRDNTLSQWFKRMKSFSTDRMLELLHDYRPTEVVSTFPGAAAAMSYLKCNGLTTVPTVTVMTDYTDHSYWVHPGTDRYLVGAEHLKKVLLRYGVSESHINVTGIPVRLPFTQDYNRDELRDKYGLDRNKPAVLIMGGGHGLIGKQFADVLRSSELALPVQFIFVCGRNAKLKQRLEEAFCGEESNHTIRVMGFVDHIHELMALSDMIITKPGGLTVSEAMALELPMLLYNPIPGQEEGNAEYLIRLGAAIEAYDPAELKNRLLEVLSEPAQLSLLRKNAGSNRLKEGARQALNAILEPAFRQMDSYNNSPAMLANG
jgi:processive 1,2-diacylglycerol beta-glucosyltransferase